MRRSLAVLALLAGSLVAVAGTAAPAEAYACGDEHASGYIITNLLEHNMGCAAAGAHAQQVILHGGAAPFHCRVSHHADYTGVDCIHGHKWFTFRYRLR